jgi:hypothetical protein
MASMTGTIGLVTETAGKHTLALSQTGTPPPEITITPPEEVDDALSGQLPPTPDAADWALTLEEDDTVLALAGTLDAALIEGLTGIVFEYRLDGDTEWTAAGLEGPETTHKTLTGLAPGDYEVSIRYLNEVGLSETRLILGPETVLPLELIIDGQI